MHPHLRQPSQPQQIPSRLCKAAKASTAYVLSAEGSAVTLAIKQPARLKMREAGFMLEFNKCLGTQVTVEKVI